MLHDYPCRLVAESLQAVEKEQEAMEAVLVRMTSTEDRESSPDTFDVRHSTILVLAVSYVTNDPLHSAITAVLCERGENGRGSHHESCLCSQKQVVGETAERLGAHTVALL